MPVTRHHPPPKYVLSGTPRETVQAIAGSFINALIVRAIILNAVVPPDLPHQVPITPTQLRSAEDNSNPSMLCNLSWNHSRIL